LTCEKGQLVFYCLARQTREGLTLQHFLRLQDNATLNNELDYLSLSPMLLIRSQESAQEVMRQSFERALHEQKAAVRQLDGEAAKTN
jgi:hypothetical protein